MQRAKRFLRRAGALCLAAVTLWAFSVTLGSSSAQAAFASLKEEAAGGGISLLRWELGDLFDREGLSLSTLLALSQSPLLLSGKRFVTAQWLPESSASQDSFTEEEREGTLIQPAEHSSPGFTDNGMPERTLTPSSQDGYVISGSVYVSNASNLSLSPEDLAGGFAARLSQASPQVLIIHTHGTEAYTMPAGQEYEASGDHRSTDCDYNMVRVGDEIAAELAKQGISVLHDRALYDYPSYSGAYDRSYEAICAHLKDYPSISFVLDVHRDAISDGNGTEYKVVSQTGEGKAAQMEFVMGSSGGGNSHEHWLENLKLAAAIQQDLLQDYPTLMRPISLRNGRYNQQLTLGSLLLEVGAAGNSLDEALLSARLFAQSFARVLGK